MVGARVAALVLAATVATGSAGQIGGADGGVGATRGVVGAQKKTFELWSNWSESGASRAPVAAVGERPTVETQRAPICWDGRVEEPATGRGGVCPSGAPVSPRLDCEDQVVDPLWRRLVYADGTATPWQRLDEGSCGPVLPVLTVEDFRSLPIPAPVLRLQPDRGWVLINIETIVTTDDTPVPLRTTLAGVGVDVEAIPQVFRYDFGDGHDLVTRSAGRPYPDHDTFHEYETPGTYAITLSTQWAGRYRVDGDPTWREVTGTATTTATSPPFTAEERTSRLVAGTCDDRPKPPDC